MRWIDVYCLKSASSKFIEETTCGYLVSDRSPVNPNLFHCCCNCNHCAQIHWLFWGTKLWLCRAIRCFLSLQC